jgi:hypothetical protein
LKLTPFSYAYVDCRERVETFAPGKE